MKNLYLLFFISLLSVNFVSAQSSYSESGGVIIHVSLDDKSTANFERGSYSGKPHVLGDSITSLLDKVEETYIYYHELGGAYSTKDKKVEKPEIYFPLMKVIKHYDKSLRKGKISEAKAYSDLELILNNAIKLKNYKTEDFETLLDNTKNKDELAKLFLDVRFM